MKKFLYSLFFEFSKAKNIRDSNSQVYYMVQNVGILFGFLIVNVTWLLGFRKYNNIFYFWLLGMILSLIIIFIWYKKRNFVKYRYLKNKNKLYHTIFWILFIINLIGIICIGRQYRISNKNNNSPTSPTSSSVPIGSLVL